MAPHVMRSSDYQWNRFFSSLAFAEKAAAEQFEVIADGFRDRGDRKQEAVYRGYAEEERRHFELVSGICRELVEPSPRAKQAYQGGLMSPDPSLAERLANVHLGFEPSALAFLGYFCRNSSKLLLDQEWARTARSAFRQILRDEVGHVYRGSETVEREWKNVDAAESGRILQSLRRHRAFLSLGLKSFFRDSRLTHCGTPFVEAMIKDYQSRVTKLSRRVAPKSFAYADGVRPTRAQ